MDWTNKVGRKQVGRKLGARGIYMRLKISASRYGGRYMDV